MSKPMTEYSATDAATELSAHLFRRGELEATRDAAVRALQHLAMTPDSLRDDGFYEVRKLEQETRSRCNAEITTIDSKIRSLMARLEYTLQAIL